MTRDTGAAGSPAPKAALFSFYYKAWRVSSAVTSCSASPWYGPSARSALLVASAHVGRTAAPLCLKVALMSRKETIWFSVRPAFSRVLRADLQATIKKLPLGSSLP